MALIFGASLIIGAVARVQGSDGSAIMIAVALTLLAVVLPRPQALLAGAGMLGFGVGLVFAGSDQATSPANGGMDLPSEISGTVVADPRLASSGVSAPLRWRMADGTSSQPLLIYSSLTDIGRGDTVLARGEWIDGSTELFAVEDIRVVDRAGRLERFRQRIRAAASSNVLERTPGSNGSLALGLIIGDDSGLTVAEREAMRASGLSHITAVSGSNVALVIVVVGFLFRALNRRGAFWLLAQLIGVVIYVWVVGADPPIVRAAIMGSLALVAITAGRPTHLFTLLFLAGGAMCVHNPDVLSSLAFQLSFMAMLGLAIAGNLVTRVSGRWQKVLAALLTPTGAALLTAPLIAGKFGTFSLGTIPANIIVAPLIWPATVLAGVVASIPSAIFIGDLLGVALWVLTAMILWVALTIGELPRSVVTFEPLTNAQVLGIYLFLGVIAAPLVPEVRLIAFRARKWTIREPGLALTSLVAGLVMVAGLAFTVD